MAGSRRGSRVAARVDRARARPDGRGLVRPQRARSVLAARGRVARRSASSRASRTSCSSGSISASSRPGEPMSMYHWEADQEDFLVLAGEALLIAEGDERPLRQWDFVHCPPGTNHVIVGAGEAPCVVLAVGARDRSTGPGLGRLHRGRGRAPPRRRRRAGDDRRAAGVRAAWRGASRRGTATAGSLTGC